MKMQKVDINPILVEVVNDPRQRTDNVNVVINLEINLMIKFSSKVMRTSSTSIR
ncbi:MAG: hypothetical protein Ct9H300mP29_7260 [Candidatus Neomarinimicrobiota bacterium]|nr:MAG: hypothetical protein Ct9H300mP29_7260 [Candidatus Neomarinimicrobiota bacterium]